MRRALAGWLRPPAHAGSVRPAPTLARAATQGDELGAADGFYGTAVPARRAAGEKALAARLPSPAPQAGARALRGLRRSREAV